MKELKITINKDGKFTMKMKGHEGPGCLDELNAMMRTSGGEITSKKPTEEYYKKSGVKTRK